MQYFKYYFRIWKLMARNSLLNWTINRRVLIVFLIGKVIRFIFYFGFLYFLVVGTNGFLGYSKNQILFFTATFFFIDSVAQFFFREVYNFRSMVVTGDFDMVLVKPVNALFRVLMGAPDPIDFVTLPPIVLLIIWLGASLHPSLLHATFYLLLVANGLLIATALHIFVLGIGIMTLEVDHLVMVYRDLESMGRFPIDIYKEPLKSILTFVVPIGLMVTIPAKALGGFLSPYEVILTMIFGIVAFVVSLKFWKFALKRYTSASS